MLNFQSRIGPELLPITDLEFCIQVLKDNVEYCKLKVILIYQKTSSEISY